MNQEKIWTDFVNACYILGEEILTKEQYTAAEDNFIKQLDTLTDMFDEIRKKR